MIVIGDKSYHDDYSSPKVLTVLAMPTVQQPALSPAMIPGPESSTFTTA